MSPPLQLAGIAVDAVSVGGLLTCIQLPGFDVAFDMGRADRSAVCRSTVLFTHAHIDHMGDVAAHCATRSLLGMAPPTYLVPAENIDAFHALMDAWRALDRSELACTVLPAAPGTRHDLGRGRFAQAFRVLHRVPCLGWSIWERREKLRPELVGRSSAEIRAARERGERITDATEAPVVAFSGDTLIEAIDHEPILRQAKLLVLEVTFLDDRVSVADCRSKGHVHLDEVIDRADAFENEAILFTHTSARYGHAEALDILRRRLPPSLAGRVTLLPPPEHR
jgi:ribonuclease Z